LVVAGPGAGKSEFLAQRAAYLLETALCKPPQHILAISFKADAAANLAARVRKRCPPELAERFTSMTFDAFTKGLVDRFKAVIPQYWQPTQQYDIGFPSRGAVEDELRRILRIAPPSWQRQIAGYSPAAFESHVVGRYRLATDVSETPSTGEEFAIHQWLREQISGAERSKLTFVTLNRLAELVLRANPRVAQALRQTYPYVFVDEFQDTSFAQYDFLLSAFGQDRAIVTAVGDHKQRIMGWAGARDDAFEQFERDFAATRINLLFNFRSSPELVRVQHLVARALDPHSPLSESRVEGLLDRDVVQIWKSAGKPQEAQHIAEWIAADMAVRQRLPRDYVLLVRQRPDQFELELQPFFASVGLSLRNESRVLGRTTIQDLMVDDAASVAIAILRLAIGQRSAAAWHTLTKAVYALHAVADESEVLRGRIDLEIQTFLIQLRQLLEAQAPSADSAIEVTRRIFAFLDATLIKRVFSAYSRNDLLDVMMEAFSLHLQQTAVPGTSWATCIDQLSGLNDIPLMTVHKSKGLEYDTILFVGLDDRSWWSHTPKNPEGIATFFVALSRARQRAIFMFCEGRGTRERVSELYQLLLDAGVEELNVN
jgi:superfamily I DNA/RNA helicase